MKVLGEDHKLTLMSLNNLGGVYSILKNHEKAMEYYERALEGYEKTLGGKHPRTVSTVINIGVLIVA